MSENTYRAAETVRAEGTLGRVGQGNPFAGKVAELREGLYRAVKAGDIEGITRSMIQKAKEGHVGAAKLVFGYVLGRPMQAADRESAMRQVQKPVLPEIAAGQFDDLLRKETPREMERRRRDRQQTGLSPSPNGVFDPAGDSAGLRVVPPGKS